MKLRTITATTVSDHVTRLVVISGILLLLPMCGFAQKISIGLNAGLPLTELAEASDGQTASTGRYTFGPSFRLDLPGGFALDVEFLYKQMHFGFTSDGAGGSIHRIELPLMLRYAFPGKSVRPFVHLGISYNRVIAVSGASECAGGIGGEQFYCIGGRTAVELRHRHTYGPLCGAGVSFPWGKIRLAPELRLTQWVDRNFGTRDSSLRSNPTQLELLVDVKF